MKRLHLILLLVATYCISFAQDQKVSVKYKTLPSAIVQDMSGKKIDIATYGKNERPTIFTFWATWCVPCKKELNNFADLYEDWQDEFNVEIVAVSVDDSRNYGKVKTYANTQDWGFDVLIDTNSDLKRALNFQAVPYLILVDEEGRIVYAHTGYVEGDEYELEEVMTEKL